MCRQQDEPRALAVPGGKGPGGHPQRGAEGSRSDSAHRVISASVVPSVEWGFRGRQSHRVTLGERVLNEPQVPQL